MKLGTGLFAGAVTALAWLTACGGDNLPQDDTQFETSSMALKMYGNLFGVRTFTIVNGVQTETPYYGPAALNSVATWGFPVKVEDQNENSQSTSVKLYWADGTSTGFTPIPNNTANTSFLQHNDAGRLSGHTFNLTKINGVWKAWAAAGTGSGVSAAEAFYGNPSPALAVVTTNEIVSHSTMLGAYVAFKRQNRTTLIVTEDTTYLASGTKDSHGWAAGVTLPQPINLKTTGVRADAIYAWLKANYRLLGIMDVLLIGDPDPTNGDLPMKQFWANKAANPPDSMPSDYYYSNLTYAWPKDAAGDISVLSDIDFLHQDLNVGRVPIKVEESDRFVKLDTILTKFINYTSSKDTAWRKNALLAMNTHNSDPELPTSGNGVQKSWVPFGEAIRDQILTPSGFSSYRVYPNFTVANCNSVGAANSSFPVSTCNSYIGRGELRPTSEVNVGSVWAGSAWSGCSGAVCSEPKRNFGVVAWAAHGGSNGAANVISIDQSTDYSMNLDDSHPAFVAASACNNSQPDTDSYATNDNVGAALLRRGAIGFLGATRISWPAYYAFYDTNLYGLNEVGEHDVTFGFVYELVKNKLTAGEALSALRIHLGSTVMATDARNKVGYAVQLLMFNLYGDPTIALENAANSDVVAMPSQSEVIVVLAANQKATLFASDWPSKDGNRPPANIVLRVTSRSGAPSPSGTVLWVNGQPYSIGGSWYQELDIADKGPYTIEISTTAAVNLGLVLGER